MIFQQTPSQNFVGRALRLPRGAIMRPALRLPYKDNKTNRP
jgi:hypothetical protein